MSESTCSVDGCEMIANHKKQVLCEKHYYRLRRWGSTDIVKKIPKYDADARCSIDGCDGAAFSLHLCRRHYGRQYTYGDPEHPPQKRGPARRPPSTTPCSVDGCDVVAIARTLCRKHYNRAHLREMDALARTAITRANNHARRARVYGAERFRVTESDWSSILRAYRNCCAYCGRSDVKLTRDHVIPLSRGGRHSIGNLVPACRSCNSSKRQRLLVEWRSLKAAALAA